MAASEIDSRNKLDFRRTYRIVNTLDWIILCNIQEILYVIAGDDFRTVSMDIFVILYVCYLSTYSN